MFIFLLPFRVSVCFAGCFAVGCGGGGKRGNNISIENINEFVEYAHCQ